jgi:hypothetical protein
VLILKKVAAAYIDYRQKRIRKAESQEMGRDSTWVTLLKIAQPFMAGKRTERVPVPYGTAELLSSLRDFRIGAREPSAKALGYFQQKLLRFQSHPSLIHPL